ncbi:SRPBCC domain-containing protein [Fodinicola acaciae]|uniref:SRPBCC domain-containing protein n=1 Tax=Fodinicola acaciae TaxID=2681555 RepID=UPI0013D05EC1|nr:SRPBCC domain-containing protein [Fodinicola acaciae]
MSLSVRTPSDREILTTRAFDAPRELVFAALTQPELLKQWHGARGWQLIECAVDLRPGGAWRFVSRGPGGATMGMGGTYREIDPPDRLVYLESYDDQWFAGECLVTAQLSGATVLTQTFRYESRRIRDHVLASPMRRGLGESYDRLAAAIAIRGEIP